MWALKLLEILVNRRKFIFINTLAVTIAAIAISFIVPRTYVGKSTILPPESESPLSGLMGLSAGNIAAAVTNFSLPIMATPSDLFASMLESDAILRGVVDSLNLQSAYDLKTETSAVAALRKNIEVTVGSDGIITVKASARDRQLAADIANLMVSYLDQLNRRLQNAKGREYSAFLAERLTATDSALDVAQNELRQFQENHRAISLELQSEALITNLAQQKAELTNAEIQLEILKKTLYPSHPEVIKKQMEVDAIATRLQNLEEGAKDSEDSTLSALDIPLSRIPDLSLQLAVLKRNAKIQEMTYEMLSQQLEMARLQERRDTPTISVLDVARPPEQAAKPQKRLIAIAAFVLSLLGSSTIAVFRESIQRRTESSDAILTQFAQMLGELKRKPLG